MADEGSVAILMVRVQLGDDDPHGYARVTWLTDVQDNSTQTTAFTHSREGIGQLVSQWLDLIGMPRNSRRRGLAGGPELDP